MTDTNTTANAAAEYADGTVVEFTVSLFDRMAAEKYAVGHGWGGGLDSSVRQTAFANYSALRRAGKIAQGIDFDHWADTVVAFPDPTIHDSDDEEVFYQGGQTEASAN